MLNIYGTTFLPDTIRLFLELGLGLRLYELQDCVPPKTPFVLECDGQESLDWLLGNWFI